MLTGLVLVLLTAVARNYDQTFVLETPFWLIGPLVFSFISGSFLFSVLYRGFLRPRFYEPKVVSRGQQWRCFMGLFWMTAPVAWLYAIPVERFLGSYRAAQANLTLLAVVSLWRVLLMARVVSVLQGRRFWRALGWVLVPACLEVLLVVFFGAAFGKQIMAAMSGMRNAPEENLLAAALGNVFIGAFILLVLTSVLLAVRRDETLVRPFPEPAQPGISFATLIGLAAVWAGLSVVPQLEQHRFVTHARLLDQGSYRESIDYLVRHNEKDFPASRRLEPNPYERRVFQQLPETIAVLRPTDTEWIRRVYVGHLDAMFSHRWISADASVYTKMFVGLERLPEAKAWVDRNRTNIGRMQLRESSAMTEEKRVEAAGKLRTALERLGFSEKDLEEVPRL